MTQLRTNRVEYADMYCHAWLRCTV